MNPLTDTRHVHAQIPTELHRRLRDLAYDTGRPIGVLMVDAVLLLLSFHDKGEGLPEMTLPGPRGEQ